MNEWTELTPPEEVWSNEWIKVLSTRVRLPTGVETDFFMLSAADGVAVIAVDEENRVVLNQQFRPALKKAIWELPAGLVENGEDPAKTAYRELSEESGVTAKEIQYLGSFYRNPARDTGSIHVYFARVGKSVAPRQERYEHLETIRLPLQDLIAQVLSNEIQDMTTIFATLMLQNRLTRGDIRL